MQIDINKFLPEIFFLKIRRSIYFLTIIFSIIQLFISSFDLDIIFILFFINFVSIFNLEICLKKEKLLFYIIPASMVIFINFFYLLFPLFIKSILGQNILNNLEIGFKSYQISIVYVITATLCFSLFVKITNYSNVDNVKRNLFTKLNLFRFPNTKSVVSIFFVTLLIKLYLVIYQNSFIINQDFGNIFIKFLFGFEKFFYLPIILIFNLYFSKKITKKFFTIFLTINFLLSIFFSISTNSRSEIFEIIIIVLFCYFIYFVQGKIKINRSKFILIFILLFISSFMIESISKKILEFRPLMYDVNPIDLFKITVGYTDVDYKIIKANKDENQEYIYTGYNILDRFTPIKHLDKSLYDSSFFSFSDKEDFSRFAKFKVLSLFPQNFLKLFLRDYDKREFQLTVGSKIERLAYHRFGGKFNKGSYIAEIFLTTNSYFFTFVIIGLVLLITFYIISCFQKIEDQKIILSPIILILIFKILYSSQSDSLTNFFTFAFRQPVEIILLFNILLFFISNFSKKKFD